LTGTPDERAEHGHQTGREAAKPFSAAHEAAIALLYAQQRRVEGGGGMKDESASGPRGRRNDPIDIREIVRQSRAAQGLPPTIDDPEILASVDEMIIEALTRKGQSRKRATGGNND
jgi:hypothetical protein